MRCAYINNTVSKTVSTVSTVSTTATTAVRTLAVVLLAIAVLQNVSLAENPEQTTEQTTGPRIDRHAVVARHNLHGHWNLEIPVGNGEFCFNVDGTGLQTLRGNSMSHWGWHSNPLPDGFKPEDVPATATYQQGRNRGGDNSFPPEKQALRQWLFDNPHIANLGRIRFVGADSQAINTNSLRNIDRTYDLWTGLHTSRFTFEGVPVTVETLVRLDSDIVVVRCRSKALANGKLAVGVDFPYPTNQSGSACGNFSLPDRHTSQLTEQTQTALASEVTVLRTADQFQYKTTVTAAVPAKISFDQKSHAGEIRTDSDELVFAVQFGQIPTELIPLLPDRQNKADTPATAKARMESLTNFDRQVNETASDWESFWLSGAAIDLSESTDPRWKELERRIVLSQYLTRVNSAGSFPPAETGLMGLDPWRSQFHGEMIYWHVAHYALWNRWELTEPALDCYRKFMPLGKQLAAQLGYKGCQWGKSMGPEGRTAPWSGNQVLLWKQPHPILFAELEYRLRPNRQTLEKWSEIIDQTAMFMADYPTKDETDVYHLTPVMPPSETGITNDTVFDLAYWRWGLENANRWRERLGQARNDDWDTVRKNLAPLPLKEGLPENESVFVHAPQWQQTYEFRTWEHPDIVGVFGMLPPTEGVDPAVAARSTLKCFQTWQWNRVWGWDFPWTAMSAAKTGQPELAVDILLHTSPRNAYDERGVNANNPCPYLPGNGGTLYAVALMAGGWDGCPEVDRLKGEAPGFPRNGKWVVRSEGFVPAP